MENKKYLPLKIIHMLLILAVFALSALSMSQINANIDTLGPLAYIKVTLSLVALASAFGYLLFNSNKDASIYYKAYMYTMLLLLILHTADNISNNDSSFISALLMVLQLVLFMALTVGKDLGKRVSFILAGLLIACAIVLTVITFTSKVPSNLLLINISTYGTLIILSITTAVLVSEKYIDKQSRGTK